MAPRETGTFGRESDLAGSGERRKGRSQVHDPPDCLSYTLSAAPIHFGITGRKSYLSGSDMRIRIQ
jgi:hypothetical protein